MKDFRKIYFTSAYRTLRAYKLFEIDLTGRKVTLIAAQMIRVLRLRVTSEKLWTSASKFDVEVFKCSDLCYRLLANAVKTDERFS